jgi:hypothetical protein
MKIRQSVKNRIIIKIKAGGHKNGRNKEGAGQ